MRHLRVAEARARFGEILDDAERGESVVIERRGVRFRLVAEVEPLPSLPQPPLFEFVDDAVVAGQWTWNPRVTGLEFAPRRKRR